MRSPPAQRDVLAMGEAPSGEAIPDREAASSRFADGAGAGSWPHTEYRGMSAWLAAEADGAAARGVAPARASGAGLDTCLSAPTAAEAASAPDLFGAGARGSDSGVPETGDSGMGDLGGGVGGLRAGSKASMAARWGAAGPLGSGRPDGFNFGATMAARA